jgi:hypothetical protein
MPSHLRTHKTWSVPPPCMHSWVKPIGSHAFTNNLSTNPIPLGSRFSCWSESTEGLLMGSGSGDPILQSNPFWGVNPTERLLIFTR